MTYNEALDTGRVVIGFVRENPTKPLQLTVQFKQRIAVPSTGKTNILVAKAQGIENAGKNTVSALLSFKRDVAATLGLEVKEYANENVALFASDIFGEEPMIRVWENFSQPSYVNDDGETVVRENYQPKRDPRNGDIMCVRFGDELRPVYRHTELVAGESNPIVPEMLDLPEDFNMNLLSEKNGNFFISYTDRLEDPAWLVDSQLTAVEMETAKAA